MTTRPGILDPAFRVSGCLMHQVTEKTLLVLGGTSELCLATAARFAMEGFDLLLAARDVEKAAVCARRIADISGRDAEAVHLDLLDSESCRALLGVASARLPDVVLMGIGIQLPQEDVAQEPDLAELVYHTNFTQPARLLAAIAKMMDARGVGSIIAIGSMAGVRGRASNYVYGSSKAALDVFLSGLRARLARRGVHVMTVISGYARTRMTERRALPSFLTVEPQEFADYVWRGYERRRSVIYVKPVWRLIAAFLRAVPDFVRL